MRRYTSEDFIKLASGQYLSQYVDSVEEVTSDMVWEPLEHLSIRDVCCMITSTAGLMADAANKAYQRGYRGEP